jgi:hypothetical protein
MALNVNFQAFISCFPKDNSGITWDELYVRTAHLFTDRDAFDAHAEQLMKQGYVKPVGPQLFLTNESLKTLTRISIFTPSIIPILEQGWTQGSVEPIQSSGGEQNSILPKDKSKAKDSQDALPNTVSKKDDLKAVKTAEPRKHYVIGTTLFWMVALPVVGGAFLLGLYFGSAKFDEKKNELYTENRELKDSLKSSRDSIAYLKANLIHVGDSITKLRAFGLEYNESRERYKESQLKKMK